MSLSQKDDGAAKPGAEGCVPPYKYSRRIFFERLEPIRMECIGEKFGDAVSTPLQLVEKHVLVEVVAGMAKTSVTMKFENTHTKTLEGQLIFPLPKDVSVHGYALDVNGVLVDAVPVEKEKARKAFEETVRTGGPAISIAEKVDATSNAFKTRVYPMNPGPGNARTVKVVTLVQLIPEIAEEEGEGEADGPVDPADLRKEMLYWLSMDCEAERKHLKKLTVQITGSDAKALVLVGDELQKVTPVDIAIDTAAKGLLVKVPCDDEAAIYTEKDPDAPGCTYFSATANVSEATGGAEPAEFAEKVPLKKVLVAYDVSHSRGSGCQRAQETALLGKLLAALESPEADVEVLTFSNTVHEKKTFRAADADKIAAFLLEQICDGGTCIPFDAISKSGAECTFLFSDGLANYGPDVEESLRIANFPMPIYSISSSGTSSYLMLRYVAEKTAGCFHDMTTDPEEAILELIAKREPIPTLRCVEYQPGEFSEIVGVVQQGRVMVYGKLDTKSAELRLHLNGGRVLSLKIGVTSDTLLPDQSTIVRTLWAQRRIDRLSIFSEKNKKQIEEIGMKYGICSEHSSLIVMSELEQYQKYNICPPKQLIEMRRQYLATIRSGEQREEDRVREKLNSVAPQWEARIRWHKKDYPSPGPVPSADKGKTMDDIEEEMEGEEEGEGEALFELEDDVSVLCAAPMSSLSSLLGSDSGAPVGDCAPMEEARSAPAPVAAAPVAMEEAIAVSDEIASMEGLGIAAPDMMEDRMEMEVSMEEEECVMEEECASMAKEDIMEEECVMEDIMEMAEKKEEEEVRAPPMKMKMEMKKKSMKIEEAEPEPMLELEIEDCEDVEDCDGDVCDDDDEDDDSDDEDEMCESDGSSSSSSSSSDSEEEGEMLAFVGSSSASAAIKVKDWTPDADYMKHIKSAFKKSEAAGAYKEYLKQKQSYITSPAFYLDVSDYFLTCSPSTIDYGVRVLSTILELELSNPQLLRIVGYRLDQAKRYHESIQVFEQAKKLRPEEPQSYRDVALIYEKVGDHPIAARLLWKVITGKWDGRFSEVELTAAIELNHVLFGWKDKVNKERFIDSIDKRFVYLMDVDIRISMAWDTDMTDIDLHVYDPYKEHCYYSHKKTRPGGFISRDFTQGYGPEEFMQKKVHSSGKFRITAKYFGSHQQSLTGGTTILCSIFTNYLREKEKAILSTLRLSSNKEEVEVCIVGFDVDE